MYRASVPCGVLSVIFLIVAAVFETLFHFLFVLAVTGMMLIAEVLNTAIKALCDYIQPEYDERIKIVKDIAAGPVMIAILIWYGVLLGVVYEFGVVTGWL